MKLNADSVQEFKEPFDGGEFKRWDHTSLELPPHNVQIGIRFPKKLTWRLSYPEVILKVNMSMGKSSPMTTAAGLSKIFQWVLRILFADQKIYVGISITITFSKGSLYNK